jgi:hypothetical protein
MYDQKIVIGHLTSPSIYAYSRFEGRLGFFIVIVAKATKWCQQADDVSRRRGQRLPWTFKPRGKFEAVT